MKNTLIFAFSALLILGVLFYLLPKGHSGELQERRDKEVILLSQIDSLNKALNSLSKANENLTLRYDLRGDSVKELQKKAGSTRVIYQERKAATDSKPDSVNMALELDAARTLIDDQEAHINGLLDLNAQADQLLALRLQIIQNQDITILTLKTRFDNMVEMKDKELKQERRKGNKKFFKGAALGGIVVGFLVLI